MVIALSLMAFILLILISLTAFISVENRHSVAVRTTLKARQNAQLSLILAVGELQKYAGEDQRATARADISSANSANPFWTGIWNSNNASQSPAWLVSGNESLSPSDPNYQKPSLALPDPTPPYDTIWLIDHSVNDPADRVKVPTVDIQDSNGNSTGKIAYWVGDEGIKAKFNIDSEYNTPTSSQSGSPTTLTYQFGINEMDTQFSSLNIEEDPRTGRAISLSDISLLANDTTIAQIYRHDLTAYNQGLLTDVLHGGLKKDLTFAFENNSIYQIAFGANANDPKRFLIDNLKDPDGNFTGPNWDILRDYYNLYKDVSNNRIEIRRPAPDLYSPIRSEYTPYNQGYVAWNDNDIYHRNNPLNPVISRLQLDFALRTVSDSDDKFEVFLDVRPSVGLYNPYNNKRSSRGEGRSSDLNDG
ncbi:hypothetical protein [Puniceicoccus vermicola]|uniref:Uncharacterized protein n=1 Tax=Puniceicoccus vermicola TaxID=388746 RepID=A0A7X1B1M3_9BACT|nr:hypothetical protein [Puniceicoccus vermicola]MBC2602805.1 hypothetical protein [Puniceicoccus vermicola]